MSARSCTDSLQLELFGFFLGGCTKPSRAGFISSCLSVHFIKTAVFSRCVAQM